MREKLIVYVRNLFRNSADKQHNRELEAEILQNSLDRFDDLIAQGISEEDAYRQVVGSVGNVQKPKKRTGWIIAGICCVAVVLLGMAAVGLRFLDRGFGSSRDMELDERLENWAEGLEENVEQWVKDAVPESNVSVVFGSRISYTDSDQYQAGATVVKGAVKQIEIHWISGEVRLEPWDGDALVLEETGNRTSEEALRWRLQNGTLTVRYCQIGNYSDLPAKNLVVKVPEEMAEELRIAVETVSAACVGTGLNAAALEIDSTSGDLQIDGTFRNLSVETVSGAVTISGIIRGLEVDTTSGDTELNLLETPDELSFDGVSGNLTLTLPGERSFEVEMDTVSGNFTCDFKTSRSDDAWFYDSGNRDAGAELEMDTVSGDVTVRKR